MNLKSVSFGGTAALTANMALITGLQAAMASKTSVIVSLLITAIADNLTDSLSVHIYQESEGLEPKAAFATTVSNFFTRLSVSLSFIFIVYLIPPPLAVATCISWGLLLLCSFTFLLARQRQVSVLSEMTKHVLGAITVIFLSKWMGHWILVTLNP